MGDAIVTSAEAMEAAALPKRHEAHCTAPPPRAGQPVSLTSKPVAQKSPAEWAHERLVLYIQAFEAQLDNEHEVAMGFTGADAGVLRIEGMGFFDPDMVTFYGSDASGAKTQLVQHVSQLNVMLRALPKAPKAAEPVRIGFRLARALEDEAS
ncbi:DUF6173 family protein [uncultured Lentibacter sp.]|jgi:hypothetical protein|uniref:DUF6173 family protein n=1 Tax=uncultured Lentibacter sp. TaxID=1659309 RepID=UPI002608466D|nr:DUF6173 family protein [uncultured Lentibacter sp.]